MKGIGIRALLISEAGHHYPVMAQLCFYCTNNMAEYEVCILGLRLSVDMGVQEVLVLGDSDLLVHQIQGEWETRDLKLIPYHQCLQNLYQRFRLVEFRHIPRIHNEVADTLATLSLMCPPEEPGRTTRVSRIESSSSFREDNTSSKESGSSSAIRRPPGEQERTTEVSKENDASSTIRRPPGEQEKMVQVSKENNSK
uniref:Uncharacterized protein Mb2253c-like n=1 Tax=Nicotiana tabacum TaxID=4097 RepID=A0A1S4DDN3_TOBAC|nr:PREDICTED: uncharacterized protein Mb2253c-like [Nicotiana tabacum]